MIGENMDYKGIQIDDKDITYVKLTSGIYLIDGEIIRNDTYGLARFQCKNPNDIRKVTENRYIKEYTCGDVKMSVQEYNERKNMFEYECKDENGDFNNLDDEYRYRKFISSWTPIYSVEQTISDPIKVELDHIKYDTGNKYVRSAFLNGTDKDDTLYSYFQAEAWPDIINECFEELGMEYQPRLNYGATANKKVWSNSNHSGIRFAVAFGTYIFGDSWGDPRIVKGTLQDMLDKYENERKTIRNIIIRQYKKHFGDIDAGTFDFKTLLNTLQTSSNILKNVKPTAKTSSEYWRALRYINDAINQIEIAYKVIED